MNETVSGIITTYNREAIIVERAIKSMLSQTYPLFEIIVVDDNAQDSPLCTELVRLCEKYKSVKYVKQEGNKGACAARNLGIESARGDYIAFLDDDDEWLSDKTEKQIQVFKNSGNEVGLVSVSGYLLNEDSGEKTDYFNQRLFLESPTFLDMLSGDYIGSTSQPLIRAQCFQTLGGFNIEQPARQDYEMWIRISKAYKIVCIKDKLFMHRIHNGEQISRNNKKVFQGYKNIYKWYREEYKKCPPAEVAIITQIISHREIDSRIRYSSYYVKRLIAKMKCVMLK